jgi:hypothetical protein
MNLDMMTGDAKHGGWCKCTGEEVRGVAPPKTLARSATVPVAGLPGMPSPAARGGQATMPAANRAQKSSVRRVSAASLASGLHPNHTNVGFIADAGLEPE